MPFFSSFTGSKTAGRRSDGVQNNPQGSSESRGDPVTPDEKAVWLHITANQAGVTHSDYKFGDITTDHGALGVDESQMNSQQRRMTHTAQGVQTIVDNSVFNAARANTASERITSPTTGKTICPSLAVSNSVSNISKTEIVARYGSTANDHYNPDNIERDGYNDHWIDLKGDAQTVANQAGTNVNQGVDGQIFMNRNSDTNAASTQTAWSMHTNPSEQGFVPAGSHELSGLWGRGYNWEATHDIGYRPFCLEAWIYTAGPFVTGLNPNGVRLFRLGYGTIWDLCICTYDNTAPTKTDGGWNPGDINGNAFTDPNHRRYALPRFINGGSSQLNAGTANTDVLQSARMDCQQWNHIAWVRTAWGEFGDMVLFANGIEIYRASFEDYWSTTSGYAQKGYIHSSTGTGGDLTIGCQSSVQCIAYLDDVRLTMGQPVYTKNFTPPSRKLPPLRAEGEARTYQLLSDFSYPPNPKPDDLILHCFPVSQESGSDTLNPQYEEIGNWANNSLQEPNLRVNPNTTPFSNVQPHVAHSSESGRLDGGIFYFEGDQNSDTDTGYDPVHNFKIGTELNDYITNHNSGSGVFDWTIEVGFRSANANHWMANNNNDEGDKFPYNSVVEYQGGAIRTASANTLGGSYSYDEGSVVRHGSNHPSLKHWERLESYVHRHILRIESPRTQYSADSSGVAGTQYDLVEQWIVLSASRENARTQYTPNIVTDTRHLTLRGYRKLSKHLDDIPNFRMQGQGTIYYVYDGYNVDDQGGMSTGDMSLTSNTVPVTEGPLKLNTWHHAAIVYKASTKRLSLFLDGSEVAHEILENDFDWDPNGLQDTSDGQDIADIDSQYSSSQRGPSIAVSVAVDVLDVKFTARAKYDSRGYELPVSNHQGFGIDGPPYKSINPVDGSIMPSSSLQVENQLGFDGSVFAHWNVQQNFINYDKLNALNAYGTGPYTLNSTDSWWAYYSGNPGILQNVPSINISTNELKTFLTARYENVINHANNDYHITPMNLRYNIHPQTNGNPISALQDDYRSLKANSAMAINKNDNLNLGGYGSLYFANDDPSNNNLEVKPWVFANVYPSDHTGPLMIDMWWGVDHTDADDDGSTFSASEWWMPNPSNDGYEGEIFRLGEIHPSDTVNPDSNQAGSHLRVGLYHVPNSNNAYWYLRWQQELFYSHTAQQYHNGSVYTSSAPAGTGVNDYWGNRLGYDDTVLPGRQGPAGNMFGHSIQIPFAFTDIAGNNHSDRSPSSSGWTDVANAYGYTSEPEWWYHPYANSSGGTIDSSNHGITAYDNTARSNTDNSAIGEYFTMLRQPEKASRKDTSVCAWDAPTNGMHHIKAGMDSAGWVYLYVDGVLLIRVHVATYYARKYQGGSGTQLSNRMAQIGNHVTQDGTYIWGRPKGNFKGPDETGGTPYETNHLRVGPIYGSGIVRPPFIYQDIRVSNNNIDSSQIHIPYIREGLPKPVANIVYGGTEPDANNVVFHLAAGEYIVNGDGSGNHIGSDAIIHTGSSNRMRNFGWNANFNGDQSQQVNNSQWSNMAKIKDDTPGPSIAHGNQSEFSLDFDHSNTTGGLNGKNGEYLEIYHNHMHGFNSQTGYQDHTQSKWMWANNTHSNYNPFRIASVAEVNANPDLYMSSDFTIEMWLFRDFAEATDPSTNTYNGEYDCVIGSSTSSGFTLLISNWSRRANVQSGGSGPWRVINHGTVKVMNGTSSITQWHTQAAIGQRPTYGEWIDQEHAGGGIPEEQWFHLAVCRKDGKLRLFIDGQRHTHTTGVSNTYAEYDPGQTYTGVIELSQPWYIGGDESLPPAQYSLSSRHNPWAGKIEDLRIINGECIYDKDFRPPKRLKRNTFSNADLTEMVVQT